MLGFGKVVNGSDHFNFLQTPAPSLPLGLQSRHETIVFQFDESVGEFSGQMILDGRKVPYGAIVNVDDQETFL